MPYNPRGFGLDRQLEGLASPELEEPEQSFFSKYVKKPVSSLFGRTGSLLSEGLLSEEGLGLAPDAYRKAHEERMAQEPGATEDTWATLPGLGDVLTANWEPESGLGRVGKLGTELVGNLVGDPTNWIPSTLLGKAGRAVTGSMDAIRAAAKAGNLSGDVVKTLEKTLETGKMGVDWYRAARTALETIGHTPEQLRAFDLATLSGLGLEGGMAAAATAAFAPDVISGTVEAGKAAIDAAKRGEYGEALGDVGVGSIMGGLGYLMAKGAMSPREAAKVFRERLGRSNPALGATLEAKAAEAEAAHMLESQVPDVWDQEGPRFQMGRDPLEAGVATDPTMPLEGDNWWESKVGEPLGSAQPMNLEGAPTPIPLDMRPIPPNRWEGPPPGGASEIWQGGASEAMGRPDEVWQPGTMASPLGSLEPSTFTPIDAEPLNFAEPGPAWRGLAPGATPEDAYRRIRAATPRVSLVDLFGQPIAPEPTPQISTVHTPIAPSQPIPAKVPAPQIVAPTEVTPAPAEPAKLSRKRISKVNNISPQLEQVVEPATVAEPVPTTPPTSTPIPPKYTEVSTSAPPAAPAAPTAAEPESELAQKLRAMIAQAEKGKNPLQPTTAKEEIAPTPISPAQSSAPTAEPAVVPAKAEAPTASAPKRKQAEVDAVLATDEGRARADAEIERILALKRPDGTPLVRSAKDITPDLIPDKNLRGEVKRAKPLHDALKARREAPATEPIPAKAEVPAPAAEAVPKSEPTPVVEPKTEGAPEGWQIRFDRQKEGPEQWSVIDPDGVDLGTAATREEALSYASEEAAARTKRAAEPISESDREILGQFFKDVQRGQKGYRTTGLWEVDSKAGRGGELVQGERGTSADDLVQGVIAKALDDPNWRGLATPEHKLNNLKSRLKNAVKDYWSWGKKGRGRDTEALPERTAESLGGVEGLEGAGRIGESVAAPSKKAERDSVVRDKFQDQRLRAEHINSLVDRQFNVTDTSGQDGFEQYLREQPNTLLFDSKEFPGKKASHRERLYQQLNLYHQMVAGKTGDKWDGTAVPAELYKQRAAEFDIPDIAHLSGPALTQRVSRIGAKYRQILEANPEFKLPAPTEAAPEVPSLRAPKMHTPEVMSGIKGATQVGRSVRVLGGDGPKPPTTTVLGERRGTPAPSEAATYQVEHGGVKFDFTSDAPSRLEVARGAGGEGVEPSVRPLGARSIALSKVWAQDQDASVVAAALERVVVDNPSLESFSVPLVEGPFPKVRVAVSPKVEKALKQLEDKGLIKQVRVGGTLTGESAGPLISAGGGGYTPKRGGVVTDIDRASNILRKLKRDAEGYTTVADESGPAKTKVSRVATGPLNEQLKGLVKLRGVDGSIDIKTAIQKIEAKLGELRARAAEQRSTPEVGGVLLRTPERVGGADPGTWKPLARFYRVVRGGGPEAERTRLVGNSLAYPSDRLSIPEGALREADDAAKIGAAPKVQGGRGRVANIDGIHDEAALQRIGAAHAPLTPELERVVGEISKALGLGTRFGGVVSTPWRNALISGERFSQGEVWLNPLMALHRAEREGKGLRGAAENLVFDQVLHELSHAHLDSVGHGDDFERTMEMLLNRVQEAESQHGGWVDALSREELWAGLRGEQEGFARLMEEASGRFREGGRAGDTAGVAGLRAGLAEGRAASASDLAAEGANGLAAGRGVGVRPEGAVPGSDSRPAGGLGRGAGSGFGGYPERRGGSPAEVAGRGEGRPRLRVANSLTTERAVKDKVTDMTTAPESDGTKLSKASWDSWDRARQLFDRVAAGDAEAGKEWGKRLGAKPTGKGLAHAYLNNRWQRGIDDRAKVKMSFLSEAIDKDPELAKLFDLAVKHPVSFGEIDDMARAAFDVMSDAALRKRAKSGKQLSLMDVQMFRMLGMDVQKNLGEIESRLFEERARAAGLKGEELNKFVEEVLNPLENEQIAAANRLVDLSMTINQGTRAARELAIRRWATEGGRDPKRVMFNSILDRARTMLQPRLKEQELQSTINKLGVDLQKAMEEPGFFDVGGGFSRWYDQLTKAANFNVWDKLLEVYKSGLLGWPSRVANLESNTLFAGLRQMEKNLAGAVDWAYSGVAGGDRERYVSEAALTKLALRRAVTGGMSTWKAANIGAFTMKPLAESAGQFSQEALEDFLRLPGAISGKKGEFIRFMFKGMNADDALFKHLSKVDSYYRQIYRKVVKGTEGFQRQEGESVLQATERLVDALEKHIDAVSNMETRWDPRFRDIHDVATQQAREETFQDKLPSWLASMQQAMYKPGGQWLQYIFPFVKTPWNIAAETVKRTPLDWPRLMKNWSGMTRTERVDALSRHLTSAAIGGGLLALAETSGIEMSGAGPIDPEQKALLQASGWAPYSMKWPGSDKWVSYQRVEPISSLIGMLADIREGAQRGDFDSVNKGTARVMGSIAENLTNKTFLSGLEGITLVMSDPIRYAEQWLKQTEQGFVPNSIGFIPFGHLAKQMDPTYREVGINPLDVVMSKTPWLSQQLPAQLSPTGGERIRPETFGPRVFSPLVAVPVKEGPAADAARMMADIGFPVRRVKSELIWKGQRVSLTPDEQHRLALAQQEAMRFVGGRLMKDPTFRALPDNDEMVSFPGQKTKKDVLERTMRRFRDPVMAAMMPQLRERSGDKLRAAQVERRQGGGA